ncbi:MAG: FG-GAP repeat protein [Planctomycetes bacterium]|nr:FG-GAP repeat protein [Planctomycetota bacterium]
MQLFPSTSFVLAALFTLAPTQRARAGLPASFDPQVVQTIAAPPAPAWVHAANDRASITIDSCSLSAEVGAERVVVRTSAEPYAGEGTLRVTHFGRVGRMRVVEPARVALDGSDAFLARRGFVEWYRPHAQGLEQGFTIATPPESDADEQPIWIGLAFEGLLPQIFDDQSGAKLVGAGAREHLLYHSLHAFDADGRKLDARMVVDAPGVGLRIDDRGARYPITVDPVVGPPIWSFTVPMVGAGIDPATSAEALRACTAGDVNGDGYSDILVFTWRFGVTNASEEIGSAWVFHGSPGIPSAVPNWTSSGPGQLGARFGYDATPLGDVNGDGYDDVAISAPRYDNGETDEGAVFVYLGSATGLGATAAWTLEGNANNALATLAQLPGDIDGDGIHDVLLLRRIASAPVSLFRGGPTPPVAPAWTMTGTLHAFTAIAGSGVGDVNGDGRDDFLVGEADPAPTTNSVDLYFGDPVAVGGAAWSATAPTTARFGFAGQRTIVTGDFNQDGRPDLAISALENGTVPGAVFVYLNSGSGGGWFPSSASSILGGPTLFDFGHGVMSAGDVEGDGYPDLAIGSSLAGRVEIHSGYSGGILPPISSTITPAPPLPGARFGAACGTVGDLNGDGLSDLFIVSAGGAAGNGIVQAYRALPGLPILPPPPGQTSNLAGAATSRFGTSLAFTGDVDGDGINDLLVGSPMYDTTAIDAGRVELFRGTANGVSATASWSYTGTTDFQRVGASVAFAGDINGDGRTDVVVGAPGYSNGQPSEGRVLVFIANGLGGLEPVPTWSFESNEVNARLGESVAGAGDVNADGFADLVAGAPGTSGGQLDRGAAYVFLGRGLGQGGFPLELGRVWTGPAAAARFGQSVAGAGDANNDGFSEVVVGAPGVSNGESGEGRAYLYLGNLLGIDAAAAWTDEANSVNAAFGTAVGAAGDVNGDGFADLVIGAPGYQAASASGGGRVFLYRGQLGAAPIVPTPQTLDGGQANAQFGASVAFAGDTNSDGFSDVAFGAPMFNSGAGRLTVHLGTSAGVGTTPDDTYVGAAGSRAGAGLGPCGDLDGDGFSDLCFGAPEFNGGGGQLLVYVGGTQGGATTVVQQRRINSVSVIDRLGLTDSTTSFLMSAGTGGPNNTTSNPTGRGAEAVEFELESAGTLFDGQGLQRGAFVLPAALPSVFATASGLSTSERYHWRTRVVTKNPLFPHTRWLLVQGAGKNEKRLGTGVDCNANGITDQIEIAGGASDCDTNLLLDACEIALGAPDCNANGRVDSCDLPGNDVNGSLIPDDCEFQPFCFGDGTGTPCPCFNSGTPGRGCANSAFATGALLTWSGNPDVSSDTVTLLGSGMPNSTALYLQGTLQDGGGLGVQLFDGLRCITGSIVRLATKTNASNQSQYPDAGNPTVSVRGSVPAAGGTYHYQVYYRNASATFCPPATANWSNGLSVIWRP